MFASSTNDIKVLVPLDGSSLALQAIPYASALAGSRGKLVFTTVLPPVEPHRDGAGRLMPLTEQDQGRVSRQAAEYLEEIAGQWVDERGPVHVVVGTGDPAEEILRIAKLRGCY